MVNEPGPRLRVWSRWIPLVVTSPSGKTMFVCVVCGNVETIPFPQCQRVPEGSTLLPTQRPHRDPRFAAAWPQAQTCWEIEQQIIERIRKDLGDKHILLEVENQLSQPERRVCLYCYGYGCQVCVGKGTQW